MLDGTGAVFILLRRDLVCCGFVLFVRVSGLRCVQGWGWGGFVGVFGWLWSRLVRFGGLCLDYVLWYVITPGNY